jgi:hypothetical protein
MLRSLFYIVLFLTIRWPSDRASGGFSFSFFHPLCRRIILQVVNSQFDSWLKNESRGRAREEEASRTYFTY